MDERTQATGHAWEAVLGRDICLLAAGGKTGELLRMKQSGQLGRK